MATRVSERRLVDVLMEYARAGHDVLREVRHYEKRIDVVVVRRDNNEVWAIEAKTADWARALSQAIVNLAAAHRSFIAVYSQNAHRVDEALLAEHGVGLISVGTRWGEVKIIHDAPRSPYVNAQVVSRLRTQVTRGS